MIKTTRPILTGLVIALFFISGVSGAIAKERTFRGKVIDFDTKKPLEGAVVVAMWFNLKGDLFIKDLKEALTNNKGEWSIVGEEGDRWRPHPLPSFSQRVFDDILQPQFMIFKPGYEDFQVSTGLSYSFLAYPHVDRKRGLEGIILSVDAKEERYMRRLSEKSHSEAPKAYGLPFIPMKNPERRLRNLEVPFDYPDNVERLYVDVKDPLWLGALEDFLKAGGPDFAKDLGLNRQNLQEPALHPFVNAVFHFTGFLNQYTLFGLKRLRDRKDRASVLTRVSPTRSDDPNKEKEFLMKQKHLLRLFEEECKNLGMDDYKYYRKILGN
jgi:hypothetical protein